MNLWNVTYIREDCVTVSVDNRAFGLPSGAPTVTVGCFGAFVLKLRMWFSRSYRGATWSNMPRTYRAACSSVAAPGGVVPLPTCNAINYSAAAAAATTSAAAIPLTTRTVPTPSASTKCVVP